MEYILASKSPRRKELMKEISPSFEVEAISINEHNYYANTPIKTVKNICYHKGIEVANKHPEKIVISADTIVVLNGEIIGKPINKQDAINILNKLSGNTHYVITGFSIFYQNKNVTKTVKSKVIFNKLDDNLISSYVESESPLDKAGAYGIQDNQSYPIIKKIIGSYENVVGFPITEIKQSINRLNKNL